MVRTRFHKNQIHKILQKYEDGEQIQRIIKEYGISQATFYNWKAKYGRNLVNDIDELNKLKKENERLKRMFADISLENLSLRTQLGKYIDL